MSFIPKTSAPQIGATQPQNNLPPVSAGMPKGGVKVMPNLDLKGQMPLLRKKVAVAPKEAAAPDTSAEPKRALPIQPKKQVIAPKAAPVQTSPRVVPPKDPKQIGKLVMPTFKKEDPAPSAPKADISDLPKGNVSNLRNVVGAQLMKKQPAAPIAQPEEEDIVLYNGPDQQIEDDIIELPRAESDSSDDELAFTPRMPLYREEPDFLLVSVEASVERRLMISDDGHLAIMSRASLSVSVTPLYTRPVASNYPFLPF